MAFDFLSLAVVRKRSRGACDSLLRTQCLLCAVKSLAVVSCLRFKGVHLWFFLFSDDSAEFNLVNNALLSIFKMDAKGKGPVSSVNVCY